MKSTDAKKEAGKGSSASIKVSSAIKTCYKKSPIGKAAKKPGKLSTNKEKRGKKKSGDRAHAGGYGQIDQSGPGKGKVITLDFDSDDDPCDLEDEETYAKAVAEVKNESKQGTPMGTHITTSHFPRLESCSS